MTGKELLIKALKREKTPRPAWVPFVGCHGGKIIDKPADEYLRLAGHIAVEPERPLSALRTLLRTAPGSFARGESLVGFPQGSVLGIEIAFQPGAVRLAERWGVPILPVILSGAHRVWDYPFSPTLRRGQQIRMEVLDPIPPESALGAMRPLERAMKQKALVAMDAPARRYRPEIDGTWEGYQFTIDPDFPEVARRAGR